MIVVILSKARIKGWSLGSLIVILNPVRQNSNFLGSTHQWHKGTACGVRIELA